MKYFKHGDIRVNLATIKGYKKGGLRQINFYDNSRIEGFSIRFKTSQEADQVLEELDRLTGVSKNSGEVDAQVI